MEAALHMPLLRKLFTSIVRPRACRIAGRARGRMHARMALRIPGPSELMWCPAPPHDTDALCFAFLGGAWPPPLSQRNTKAA